MRRASSASHSAAAPRTHSRQGTPCRAGGASGAASASKSSSASPRAAAAQPRSAGAPAARPAISRRSAMAAGALEASTKLPATATDGPPSPLTTRWGAPPGTSRTWPLVRVRSTRRAWRRRGKAEGSASIASKSGKEGSSRSWEASQLGDKHHASSGWKMVQRLQPSSWHLSKGQGKGCEWVWGRSGVLEACGGEQGRPASSARA
eukprot:scaffold21331_cov117-Isochrysis_galbana.AAC.9